jgi:hypothetical protein
MMMRQLRGQVGGKQQKSQQQRRRFLHPFSHQAVL